MHDVPDKTQGIIDALPRGIIKQICSPSIGARKKAISKILDAISDDSDSAQLFQSIPREFASRGESLAALYFLETSIRNGSIFAPEMVEQVVNMVVLDRYEQIDTYGEDDVTDILRGVLQKLFRVLLFHREYQKDPQIHIMAGDALVSVDQIDTAIHAYNTALELGSVDSYMRLADVYESIREYEMSISLLEMGYQITGDFTILHRLIFLLCRNGQRKKAYALHTEYIGESPSTPISPFLVYKGVIETDHDLQILESLIEGYHRDGRYMPQPSLRELTHSASLYIARSIEQENQNLGALYSQLLIDHTSEIHEQFVGAISRRLYLMQSHIIILQDSTYLDRYIQDIRRYSLDRSTEWHTDMLQDYYDIYASMIVKSKQNTEKNIETKQETKIEIEAESDEGDAYYHDILDHLLYISMIFNQGASYDNMINDIFPLMDSLRRIYLISGDIDDYQDGIIHSLKRETHFYTTLELDTQESLDILMASIDQKYGMFYRRSIQNLARAPSEDGNQYLDVFHMYPDIALFYWVERLIAHQYIDTSEQNIDMIITSYHLDQLHIDDALLFAALLFQTEIYDDYVVKYLMMIPDIFNLPKALSMITDIIIHMQDSEQGDTLLHELDTHVQREYGVTDFINHVQWMLSHTIQDIHLTPTDMQYCVLTQANIAIYTEPASSDLLESSLAAASKYGGATGLLLLGDHHHDEGISEDVIWAYREAYRIEPSLVTLERIIDLYTELEQYDLAMPYIQIGMHEGYDMFVYTIPIDLALHRDRAVMEVMLLLFSRGGDMLSQIPSDLWDQLSNRITEILASHAPNRENHELKILTSYVNIIGSLDSEYMHISYFLQHLATIEGYMEMYSGNIIPHQGLIDILTSIRQYDPDIQSIMDNYSRSSLGLLDFHGQILYEMMYMVLDNMVGLSDIDQVVGVIAGINSCVYRIISLMQKFPNADRYLLEWKSRYQPYPLKISGQELSYTIIDNTSDTVQ